MKGDIGERDLEGWPRSPKYARKTAARREVIARLKTQRGVTSATSAVTVEEEQKVPNALKTLKTGKTRDHSHGRK